MPPIPRASSNRRIALCAAAICTASLASADDLNVTGNIFATGSLDINGNTASFGTSGTNPGFSLLYADGSPATIDFSASAGAANWIWHQGTSAAQMKLSSANALTLFNASTGVAGVTLNPAGNSGLGVVSPVSMLHLRKDVWSSAGPILTLMNGAGGPGAYTAIDLDSYNTTGFAPSTRIAAVDDAYWSSHLTFSTKQTPGGDASLPLVERMRITSAGNVGIGTPTPAAKLDVAGNLKVGGTVTATGAITAPSISLPDGSSLTSARATTLYNSAGTAVATVGTDGKVIFNNGLTVGTGSGATSLTPNSAAYLGQTLTNLGFRETPVTPSSTLGISILGDIAVSGLVCSGSYLYLTGSTTRGGQIGTATINPMSSLMTQTCFVAKVSPSGVGYWSVPIYADGLTTIGNCAVDSSGNVFVTGVMMGTAKIGSTTISTPTVGNSSGFIFKFSSTGILQWAKTVENCALRSTVTDSAGSVIVAGDISGPITNLAGISATSPSGSIDAVVIKFSSSGAPQWAKAIGGANYDSTTSMAVDASGNIAVAGTFQGSITNLPGFNLSAVSGSSDCFVVKLNSAGALQWSRAIGGTADDYPAAISVDSAGSIIVAGKFQGTITNLAGLANLSSAGASDGFVAKFNSSGTPQWSKTIGGVGDDALTGVAVDPSGSLVVAGNFVGATTNLGTSNIFSGSYGNGLIAKLASSDGAVLNAMAVGGASIPVIYGLAFNGSETWFYGLNLSQNWNFGNRNIDVGGFALGFSSLPVVSMPPGVPSSLSWGNSVASMNGVALGDGAYASGSGSSALGRGTASEVDSFSAGSGIASGWGASALGIETQAVGGSAFAVGYRTSALGAYSSAFGITTISQGAYSVAMGESTRAIASHQIVIGRGNVPQGSLDGAWVSTDDIFIIGNGYNDTDWEAYSNALTVHKDGKMRVANDVDIKGVVRVKAAGDISMGSFTAGANPADPTTGLDAGLRYPGE